MRSEPWVRAALSVLVLGSLCVLGAGCSSRQQVHPALLVENEDIDRAIRRGKTIISTGDDPYNAFGPMQDVNVSVSADVIIRGAVMCWPREEIAFQVAQAGDTSDRGINQAVDQALRKIEREIRFFATLQIPKTKDLSTLQFALRADGRSEYPALVVEQPMYDRDVSSPFDPGAAPSALYLFTMHFPIRGGPGVPPIGPNVRSLDLVVKDGESEGTVQFELPRPRQ